MYMYVYIHTEVIYIHPFSKTLQFENIHSIYLPFHFLFERQWMMHVYFTSEKQYLKLCYCAMVKPVVYD